MTKSIQSDIYDYVLFLDGIPADGLTYTKQLVIQSDADFEVQSVQSAPIVTFLRPSFTDTVDGVHYAGLTVDIENTGNGQRWSKTPMQVPNLFGTGKNVFTLAVSYIMERNASFNISVVNNSAVDLERLYFVFSGRKLL